MRMALTCIKTMGFALCAAAIALANGTARAQSATDADVLAARDAALRGQWKVLEAYRARFAGHILEPYPAYWLLAGNPVFVVLAASRRLTEGEAWDRVRRMLSLGNVKEAKRLNALLPPRLALH